MSAEPKSEHWRVWLRGAFAMGLPPAAFWLLSYLEWRRLTEQQRPASLSRAAFDALMRAHPDS